MQLPGGPSVELDIDVQWDFMAPLHAKLTAASSSAGSGSAGGGPSSSAEGTAAAGGGATSGGGGSGVSEIEAVPAGRRFKVERGSSTIVFSCRLNTVVAMGAQRVAVRAPPELARGGGGGGSPGEGGGVVWVQSLTAVRDAATAVGGPGCAKAAMNAHLRQMQREVAASNNEVRCFD